MSNNWGTCHWCGDKMNIRTWHHSTFERGCCTDCYNDPESNFRQTYGKDATQDDEVAEVKRARGLK